MQWVYDNHKYKLIDDCSTIVICDEGDGIGLCYTKDDDLGWMIIKYGRPDFIKTYTFDMNLKFEKDNVLESHPSLRHCYIELFPSNEMLDLFNHTLECTGRLQKYLEQEYGVCFNGKNTVK